MLREGPDRGQHFQEPISVPRKVTCHQSCHIAPNITREITHHIAQINITRQLFKKFVKEPVCNSSNNYNHN